MYFLIYSIESVIENIILFETEYDGILLEYQYYNITFYKAIIFFNEVYSDSSIHYCKLLSLSPNPDLFLLFHNTSHLWSCCLVCLWYLVFSIYFLSLESKLASEMVKYASLPLVFLSWCSTYPVWIMGGLYDRQNTVEVVLYDSQD